MALLSLFKKQSIKEKKLRGYLKRHWSVAPKSLHWYEKALRHKSIVGSGKFCHNDCNERLELLGDAVLDTVITEYLFYRFPECDEGELTKIRARIVNRQMLSLVGSNAEIKTMLELRIGNVDSIDKIAGNALEALLGAIYIDKGFHETKRVIEKVLLNRYMDIEAVINNTTDFKSQLIEWTQQQKIQISFRTFKANETPLTFTCEIHVNGELKSAGSEGSKKRAEQLAARNVCQILGISA